MILKIRLLVIAFQLLLPLHLISLSLEKRNYFPLRIVFSSLAVLLYSFFVNPPEPMTAAGEIVANILYYISLFAVCCGAHFVCYKNDPKTSVFIGIIAYTLQHSVYLIFSVFDQMLTDNVAVPEILGYIFVRRFIFSVLLIPLGLYFNGIIKKHSTVILPPNFIFYTSVITIAGEIILSVIFITEDNLILPLSGNPVFYSDKLFNLLACVLILILILSRIERSSVEIENDFIRRMNEEQAKFHRINKETIDLINLKAHDLKHQVRRYYKGTGILSNEAIRDLESTLSLYDTSFETGNKALDIILQEKALICNTKKISFETMTDAGALRNFKDIHIYSLFGNILDNAIEAASKTDHPYISLKIKTMNNIAIIQEENNFAGELNLKAGFPETTKENNNFHGFGLKSIQYVVDKYNGSLSLSCLNDVFSLTITFEIER